MIKMKKERPIVAIIKGTQYKATIKALSLIKDYIDVENNAKIILKPNLLSSNKSHIINTDPRVCLAVHDFFNRELKIDKKNIVLSAGTTHGKPPDAKFALENNDYFKFKSDWNYHDFAEDKPGKWFKIYEFNSNRNLELALAKSLIEADYIISVPKFKTHDVLGLTLSLKNLMGTLVAAKDQTGTIIKTKPANVCPLMHGFGNRRPHQLSDAENSGPSKLCLATNLIRMAQKIQPSLAVIDGVVAMEGNGPVFGVKKNLGIVIASNDFIAADTVATHIAGMEPKDIQYILQAGKIGLGEYNPDKIEIVGENIDLIKNKFIPHRLFHKSKFTQEEIAILEKKIRYN